MFNKSSFLRFIAVSILSSNLYAGDQATLSLVNETIVPEGWTSFAIVNTTGKYYVVCSQGYESANCFSKIDVPVNQSSINVNVINFSFGNGEIEIDNSCLNKTININSGETKTLHIFGIPSNELQYSSKIACSIS